MKCKNCGNQVSRNYCSQCGQSSRISRINLPNFLEELSVSIFQINRGFFFTIKELTIRPGNTIREFLAGKRRSHIRPITFLISLSTLYFLAGVITDQQTWLDNFLSGFLEGMAESRENFAASSILNWFANNYAYANLLLLPIFSLASYLAFNKYQLNYLEHIVINSYLAGQQAIIYILLVFVNILVDNELIEALTLLLSVCYTFWTYWQLFEKGSRIGNLLRTLSCYLIYLFISAGLLILLHSWDRF